MSSETVSLTEKGQEVVNDIHSRFLGGESVESIANHYGISVEAIQVLMALDSITNG